MKIEARRPFRHNGFIKKPVYLSADFKRARRLAHAILNGAYPLPPSIRAGLALLVFSITSIPCCSSFALSGFFIFNLQNRLSKFPAFRKTRKSGVALSRRPVGFSISYLSGYILIVSPIFRFSFLRGGSDGVLWANKGRAAALIPPIGRRPGRNPGRAQRRRKIPGGRR